MEMSDNCLNNVGLTKSVWLLGDNLEKCYKCQYCRLTDQDRNNYNVLPTEINPLFNNLPISVNMLYGDPFLQTENTLKKLDLLEKAEHKGIVLIITKGDIKQIERFKKVLDYNLDIHMAFSTFGKDHVLDGGSFNRFKNNIDYFATNYSGCYKYSIEYRPIIKNINDDDETLRGVFDIAKKYNCGMGYCGLQQTSELKNYFIKNNIKLDPYEGYEFGMKKALSDEYKVPIFRKTSCLMSYTHNLDRDYNAHYYRPNEMRCFRCPMKDKCLDFKINNKTVNIDLPFDYELIEKEKHTCVLHKLCKFPSDDCTNISGKLIKINEEITSSDLRLIKWLTGFTVDCKFYESPLISKKWKNINFR